MWPQSKQPLSRHGLKVCWSSVNYILLLDDFLITCSDEKLNPHSSFQCIGTGSSWNVAIFSPKCCLLLGIPFLLRMCLKSCLAWQLSFAAEALLSKKLNLLWFTVNETSCYEINLTCHPETQVKLLFSDVFIFSWTAWSPLSNMHPQRWNLEVLDRTNWLGGRYAGQRWQQRFLLLLSHRRDWTPAAVPGLL